MTDYDCYGLLISFGVMLGLAWIGSGILGFFVSRSYILRPKLVRLHVTAQNFIFATSIYGVFIMIFSIIQARIGTFHSCFNDIDKYKRDFLQSVGDRDIYRSSDAFIGESIVAWLVGGCQIAGALCMWFWGFPSSTSTEVPNATTTNAADPTNPAVV